MLCNLNLKFGRSCMKLLHSNIKQINYINKLTTTSSSKAFFCSTIKPDQDTENTSNQCNEKLLYKESQEYTIRIMMGVSTVNFIYWSSLLINTVIYKDIIVEGINLGGDPMWAFFGSFASGFFFYFTRTFANHSVYQCYESSDNKRIGFQMHTILGYPGRKFEVNIGNARFISKSNSLVLGMDQNNDDNNTVLPSIKDVDSRKDTFFDRVLKSSLIPITVDGFPGNALLDEHGQYYDKNRLVYLLLDPSKMVKSESKENRKKWRENIRKRK